MRQLVSDSPHVCWRRWEGFCGGKEKWGGLWVGVWCDGAEPSQGSRRRGGAWGVEGWEVRWGQGRLEWMRLAAGKTESLWASSFEGWSGRNVCNGLAWEGKSQKTTPYHNRPGNRYSVQDPWANIHFDATSEICFSRALSTPLLGQSPRGRDLIQLVNQHWWKERTGQDF